MNRNDFQQLADIRIAEAKVLLDSKLFDGAYYLAGYAIECALKACIVKRTNQHDFPPNARNVTDIYTHDIEKLVKYADLVDDRKAGIGADRKIGHLLGCCEKLE